MIYKIILHINLYYIDLDLRDTYEGERKKT